MYFYLKLKSFFTDHWILSLNTSAGNPFWLFYSFLCHTHNICNYEVLKLLSLYFRFTFSRLVAMSNPGIIQMMKTTKKKLNFKKKKNESRTRKTLNLKRRNVVIVSIFIYCCFVCKPENWEQQFFWMNYTIKIKKFIYDATWNEQNFLKWLITIFSSTWILYNQEEYL